MKQVNTLYKTTALIALLTAITFVVSSILSPALMMPLIIAAALWLLMAIGLQTGRRWISYFAFVLAIASSLISFATLSTDQWISIATLALSVIATLLLFALIWKHPMASHTATNTPTS